MPIVAQSTPTGRSAVAVVRMSGAGCIEIARKMFKPFPPLANTVKVGTLTVAQTTDQAMCVYFNSPHSFTGEDMVEFYCHGGVAMPSLVIEQCIGLGCRMAQNGEFSKIAFINGKQNLSTAEGIIELIDAENILQVKASNNLLRNKLGKQTVEMQNVLTDLLAESEAVLDYPEEDLETTILAKMKEKLTETDEKLTLLVNTAQAGKMIKYGVSVAICGKTNVGKSSLLNALVGSERAIVTNVAGTTRDTVTESINYRDIRFNFVDTAGIRNAKGVVEKIGIERSLAAIENADIVLAVTDNEDEISLTDKPAVIVRNKCDSYKGERKNDRIYVSAKYGENIEELKEALFCKMQLNNINSENVILTNLRHVEVLTLAREYIRSALAGVDVTTADCVVADVKNAWDALGEITGNTATQQIIDTIFSKFCLGK